MTFRDIIFKLQLHTPDGEWANDLALFVQYYNVSEQKWVNIYREVVENGLFFIKGSASSTVKSRQPFFELLQNGQIPPIRIVPTEKIYSGKKKEVIGSIHSFSLDQKESVFEFDFGVLWLVPEENTHDSDVFLDFLNVTSLYPVTTAKTPGTSVQPEMSALAAAAVTNDDDPCAPCQQELQACTEELRALKAQYDSLYTSSEELKKNYSTLKDQNEQLTQEIESLNALIKTGKTYIEQLETRIAELTKEPSTENTPVPIKTIYSDIVNEIETATRFTEASSFKLSNISLKLKAIVQKDGETMSASLLNLADSETVNGNAISELTFDITPVKQAETVSGKMPDVLGLTETAVRRVLKSVGLRLNPVYQQNNKVVNGDSFKQAPTPGSEVQTNQLVTVIFSKNEQSK